MHRGWFVWTPTPPLLGPRMPRLGPARVFVCVPLLAGWRGPVSRARFCAPHLFLWPVWVRSLFLQPPPGRGCPASGCCWGFFFLPLPCYAPVVSGGPCFPARGALGLGVLWSSPHPRLLFFCNFFLVRPLVSAFRGFRPGVPWALASCGPPARPPPFFFFRPPRLLFFFSFPLSCSCSLFVFFFFSLSASLFFFCLSVPVARRFGWFVCPGLWGVLMCVAPGVVPRRVPVCACAVSFYAPWLCFFCVCCCLSCCGVVVCFVVCPVLCGVPVLRLVSAPCCCSLLLFAPPLSWPVVVFCPGVQGCVALVCSLSCGVPLFVLCLACGAVLLRSRWLVLCVVICGRQLGVAGSGCLLLFSAGVCCRGCSYLAAWLAALLCAVVSCGAPLPCAVSSVLWCCVTVWCRAVAPCCPLSFAGVVGLCPFPVCAVLCCSARRVVRCPFGLRFCWCLVLWCVAVCCGVCLGVLWCGGAALVCRGVLLWCCVSLLCRAAVLCCVFSFAAGVRFFFQNYFSVFENKNEIK